MSREILSMVTCASVQCHGQDMAISIMVTVHNNETILICSSICLLNTALCSINFFHFQIIQFFPLAFERKHVLRPEIKGQKFLKRNLVIFLGSSIRNSKIKKMCDYTQSRIVIDKEKLCYNKTR